MFAGMIRREESEDAARRELERLRHEGDVFGGLVRRWFSPQVADPDDPAEVWGTRIGRGLSALAVIAICLYLVWVYLR